MPSSVLNSWDQFGTFTTQVECPSVLNPQEQFGTFTTQVECPICGRIFARQANLNKHTPSCERKHDARPVKLQRLKLILKERAESEDIEEPFFQRTPAEVQRYALKGFDRAQAKLPNVSPLHIVDDRYRRGEMEYLVRWEEQENPTWETVESLRYHEKGMMLVEAYYKR